MDIRSFNLDFEVSMRCSGASFVAQVREVEDRYRSLSRELTLEEWKKRPVTKRWLDNVMRLTSAVQQPELDRIVHRRSRDRRSRRKMHDGPRSSSELVH
jgi:phosphatidylserine/phosphatidylglycerophosphate/cardiolipin synthase-like enzyme